MTKVFDLDGTLLDSNAIWREIDEEFVRRRGLKLTPEYNEYVSHAIFPLAAKFTKEYYHLDDSETDIMAEWHAMAQDAYTNHLPLKPNVKAYLDQCARRGERMVVYTSSVPDLCRAALARHGLPTYFETLFFAQELMLEKKYPESFTRLAQLLGEDPEDCILFDDSPRACSAAKNAGWQVIGISDPFFNEYKDTLPQMCDRVISDFELLLD